MRAQKPIEKLDRNLRVAVAKDEADLRWYDASKRPFVIRGLPWFKEGKGSWRRLPPRAEQSVRAPVWSLAHHTAGVRVQFRTDATTLSLRVRLDGLTDFSHMPRTGVSGFALYEGGTHRWKPWPVAFPSPPGETSFTRPLVSDIPEKMREYMLYFPLYNGVESVEFGMNPDARFEAPQCLPPGKPVIFYGTSITQGGCAHNPGADFPAIIGRALDLDFVNLGFSGNGKGEDELAHLLAELDAGLFVLDYVGNVTVPELKRTLPRVVGILRKQHPQTPIALVSRVVFSSCHWSASALAAHEAQRDVVIAFYAQCRKRGDGNMHFIDGDSLIPYGAQGAYSDNGVHPSNTGFRMMAEAMTPRIERFVFPPALAQG
jgi:lysophospholipase L1-like esterase